MTSDEKIVEYGKELKCFEKLTVDQLIESHKYLREQHDIYSRKWNTMLDEARKSAEEKTLEYAKNNNLFTIDQLMEFTVAELVEILSGGSL